jgi:AraC-like DNA-binding protein
MQAQTYIENNLNEKISVEDLSSGLAVGRWNFDRRFIKATGNTPVEYAQFLINLKFRFGLKFYKHCVQVQVSETMWKALNLNDITFKKRQPER